MRLGRARCPGFRRRSKPAGKVSRMARRIGVRSRGDISISARPRSTADPTRSSATSSPNAFWDSKHMDFELTQDQIMLQDALQRFVAGEYSFEQRNKILSGDSGFSADVW